MKYKIPILIFELLTLHLWKHISNRGPYITNIYWICWKKTLDAEKLHNNKYSFFARTCSLTCKPRTIFFRWPANCALRILFYYHLFLNTEMEYIFYVYLLEFTTTKTTFLPFPFWNDVIFYGTNLFCNHSLSGRMEIITGDWLQSQ